MVKRVSLTSITSAELAARINRLGRSSQIVNPDLLGLDVTIWDLLPGLLILAASSALVIEVRHTLVNYRLDSHTHKTSTIMA